MTIDNLPRFNKPVPSPEDCIKLIKSSTVIRGLLGGEPAVLNNPDVALERKEFARFLGIVYGPDWRRVITKSFNNTHPEIPHASGNEEILDTALMIGYKMADFDLAKKVAEPLANILGTIPGTQDRSLRERAAAYIKVGAAMGWTEIASAGIPMDLRYAFRRTPVPPVFSE